MSSRSKLQLCGSQLSIGRDVRRSAGASYACRLATTLQREGRPVLRVRRRLPSLSSPPRRGAVCRLALRACSVTAESDSYGPLS